MNYVLLIKENSQQDIICDCCTFFVWGCYLCLRIISVEPCLTFNNEFFIKSGVAFLHCRLSCNKKKILLLVKTTEESQYEFYNNMGIKNTISQNYCIEPNKTKHLLYFQFYLIAFLSLTNEPLDCL